MVSGCRNSRFCARGCWIAATKMTSSAPSSLRKRRCASTQMSARGQERQRSRRESRRGDLPRTDQKRPAKFTAIKSSTQDSLGDHSRTGDSASAFLPLEGVFCNASIHSHDVLHALSPLPLCWDEKRRQSKCVSKELSVGLFCPIAAVSAAATAFCSGGKLPQWRLLRNWRMVSYASPAELRASGAPESGAHCRW